MSASEACHILVRFVRRFGWRQIPMAVLAGVFVLHGSLFAQVSPVAEPGSEIQTAFDHIVANDYEAARLVAMPLAESGNADAQHILGFVYERGLGGVTKSLKTALDYYFKAGMQGHADAQFALGELAFTGAGVVQDDARAAGWYTLAAARSHPRAQTRLGFLYANGSGVEKDPVRARDLFEAAAHSGDPDAQYNVATLLLLGEEGSANYLKAAIWFEKAAEQGHAEAQYNLALLYDSPYLGEPDQANTVKWMSAAAEAGMPAAMAAMGILVVGKAAESDLSASEWFEAAAKAGDPQGQFLFAVALAEGDGRPRDPKAALAWLDRASQYGDALDQELAENIKHLRKELGGEDPAPSEAPASADLAQIRE